MPIPSKRKGEDEKGFMSRCMSDDVMKSEYPSQEQRSAVCMSKATEGLSYIESADFQNTYKLSQSHDAGSMEKYVFESKEEAIKMAKKNRHV